MKDKFNVCLLSAMFISLLLTGCAATLHSHAPVYYLTDQTTTGIIVRFSRNMGQTGVIGHLIKVDDGEEIRVEAISELPIYLSPGPHKLRIVSISSLAKSVWYPAHHKKDRLFYFGKPVEEEIYLQENETKAIKFTAPFIGTVKGKLEIIN